MSTRTQLSDDIRTYIGRDDVADSPIFDTLLRLAEARIKRLVRPRERDVLLEFQMGSAYYALPADFLRMRSLTVDSDILPRSLDYYPPEALRKSPIWVNRSSFSIPGAQGYTIEGNRLLLAPAPSEESPASLVMVYVARYAPLAQGADSNWLLREHYDIYLNGLLAEAADHLEDGELAAIYRPKFDQAIFELNRSENRARFPRGSGLRTIGGVQPIV